MSFNRIRISEDATKKLTTLKKRTGLTPNILCRIGFCHSLNISRIPEPENYDDQGQEFNRYTLTGEWDQLYIALLKERLESDRLDIDANLLPQFRAHINRGVISLYLRVKSLLDLHDLLPQNPDKMEAEIT